MKTVASVGNSLTHGRNMLVTHFVQYEDSAILNAKV